MQISGLAANVCSLFFKAGYVHQALQQLEFGRRIILGYLIDGRSDLKNDYPLLANKYNTFWFKAYIDIEVKELIIWEQLL